MFYKGLKHLEWSQIRCMLIDSFFMTVKAERTPRSERKRRDSYGMFDGYDIDSCSEESTSSSSSEDSEDEVVPSIPASLPIIKNNGQVYTYPDGKAGMGQYICVLSKQPDNCSIMLFGLNIKGWNVSILFNSYVWDVWNGWGPWCFLFQNQALLQCILFQELFLKFQKG